MKEQKTDKSPIRVALLLLLAVLASCGADESLPADGGVLRLLQVEVEEGAGTATRAAVTEISQLNVYATTEAHSLYDATKPLILYALSGGSWNADDAPVIAGNALLYACYPPVSAVANRTDGNHTVPVTVSATAGFLAAEQPDYLYGVSPATETAPVIATSVNRVISLRMEHALAKVSFRIVKSASANEDALRLTELKIQGGTNRLQAGTGTMNLKNGVLNGLPSTSVLTLANEAAPITLNEQQATPNVTCLVAPMTGQETVLSFRLKVCINGEPAADAHVFETKSITAQWEAGRHYVYQITVDKMGGSLSSVKIDNWKSDANQNTSIGI